MPDIKIRKRQLLEGYAARALSRLPQRVKLRLSGQPPIVIDGQTMDPQLQLVLAISRKRNRYGLCEPTPQAARHRLRRDMRIFGGPKTQVKSVRDLFIEGEGGRIALRHYAPLSAVERSDVLVYLHGGGFVIGDLETHDEVCRLLCRFAETHVLSVDYRLAPEHPFPAGLNDTLAALRWAQANAASFGADSSSVMIGGDSAGANLATVAARISLEEGRPPAAQLLIYPATDAETERPSRELFGKGFFLNTADGDAFINHYLAGADALRTDPRISPLLAPSLEGMPPALVATAGFDILRDEGEAYAKALKEAGATVLKRSFSALAHGFANMTGVCPAARRAMIEIARDWRTLC